MNNKIATTKNNDLSRILAELSTNSETTFVYFTDFCRDYIRKLSNGIILTENKVRFSESTLRQYCCAVSHLTNFEKALGERIETLKINKNYLLAFEQYLVGLNLTLNSISLYQSKVKAMANYLVGEDIVKVNFRTIKTPKEVSSQTYLTINELKKLREAKITKGQEKVLDAFIIGCMTGFRNHVLRKFLLKPLDYIREEDGYTFIEIVDSKTNIESIVPLGDTVKKLISKHGYSIKMGEPQYTNRTLKKICKKAGLNNNVVVRKTVGGVMTEVLQPKWKTIGNHNSRRTLISLMRSNNFANNDIQKISGHSTEAQMLKYDKSGNYSKIKSMLGNKFFDIDI